MTDDATRPRDTPPRTRRGHAVGEPPAARADARVAWHILLQVSSRVVKELDRRLDLVHRISISEFDVLINLGNAPERRLRMTDLANAVMLSSGGLTRLVGRLEERGLVQREPDATDARGFHASLTEAGGTRLAEARVTHDSVIEELLGSRLSPREITTVAGILARALETGQETSAHSR